MVALAALAGSGCGRDDLGVPAADAGGGGGADAARQDDAGAPDPAGPAGWYFAQDSAGNTWYVAIVDIDDPDEVTVLEVGDLAALSGSSGNGQGPSWGDALASSDGARVFANASSVRRVAVFDAAARELEALVAVGDRPLHMYRPNVAEIWTHADGEGAFYPLSQQTLAPADPVVAALNNTGHGKLVYAYELGATYYATNTNDPGAHFIDASGEGAPTVEHLELCATPCEDDSGELCGATHDGGYNPAMNYAIFECSGDTRGSYAFVSAENNTVVDEVEIAGALAKSPGNEYILVIDGGAGEDQVRIWDTAAEDHDGIAFDAAATVGANPSARGSAFVRRDDGTWEAFIPQSDGDHVAVLDLDTLDVELVEIGPVTPPSGAAHFSRRGAIGGGYYFTHNDDGAVLVDLETREVVQGPALPGATSRVTFVNPEQVD